MILLYRVRVVSEQHQVSENYEQCQNVQKKTTDEGCQVEIGKFNNIEKSNSLTCIRYTFSETSCSVDIQWNFIELNKFAVNPKIMKNKCVGTCFFCDKEVTCNLDIERKLFSGYESINNRKQLKYTAGVSIEKF